MPDITTLDRNFATADIVEADRIWRDCRQSPFRVYGLTYEEGRFVRLPLSVARGVSSGVENLAGHTAGGRLRFITDSPFVAIRATMDRISRMPHFALSGVAGFDLYVGPDYTGTFMPPFDTQDGYTSEIRFADAREREITIHFPTYSGVQSLLIGLAPEASLLPAPEYRSPLPFVTYGSSITQGGCVSRPGNCYQNILSRRLSLDHVNLGFAGNARGELSMAEYIGRLPMKAFVLDYDHNAPTAEFLQQTHEPFFRVIREAAPELPILILSRPKANLSDVEKRRRDIIRATYEHAASSGDRATFWIDLSASLQAFCGNDGTVDNCHPNDLGFFAMSKALEPWFLSLAL